MGSRLTPRLVYATAPPSMMVSTAMMMSIGRRIERGYDRRDALLVAGPTRLRPILMTTSAMVFAMLPLAMKMGEGAETRAPLAIAVIGGLITSTMLTLLVVPAGYTVMDDFQQWVARRLGRRGAEVDSLAGKIVEKKEASRPAVSADRSI